MPNSLPEDRIPVIVGVGEIVDRPKDITAGLEPLALLEEALRRAEADSGAKLLSEIQSLDVVNFLSWRYRDPEKLLAARIGARPAHCYYGPVGGESPIYLPGFIVSLMVVALMLWWGVRQFRRSERRFADMI